MSQRANKIRLQEQNNLPLQKWNKKVSFQIYCLRQEWFRTLQKVQKNNFTKNDMRHILLWTTAILWTHAPALLPRRIGKQLIQRAVTGDWWTGPWLLRAGRLYNGTIMSRHYQSSEVLGTRAKLFIPNNPINSHLSGEGLTMLALSGVKTILSRVLQYIQYVNYRGMGGRVLPQKESVLARVTNLYIEKIFCPFILGRFQKKK